MVNWLKDSNHWKHIIACFILSLFLGATAGIAAGVTAEWKDKQWGGQFDWSDIIADIIGVIFGIGVRHILGWNILSLY